MAAYLDAWLAEAPEDAAGIGPRCRVVGAHDTDCRERAAPAILYAFAGRAHPTMNVTKLREAEALFMLRYPGGFQNEELQKVIGKRHNVGRLSEFAATTLASKNFTKPGALLDDIVRIASRSSMVSMFEKPKFRDFVNGLARSDREFLVTGYQRLLHGNQDGNQEQGFNDVLDVLTEGKLAKWSLMTIHLYQLRPTREVFVKPTTTKNVIRQFELQDIEYRPRPSWSFYERYRSAIDDMKTHVSPNLSPSNAAFTGFLMMSSAVDR